MRNAIIHRFRFRQFASEIGVQRSLESNRRRRRRSVLHERSMWCDSVKAYPLQYPFKISLVHSFPIPVYTLLSLEERNRSSIILLWFNKTVFAFRSRLKCKQISANDDRYDDGSLIKAVLDRIARIGFEGKKEGGAWKRATTRTMTMTMTRKFLDEGKPIGSPRSNNEEESNRAFSQVYVCAQNPMHTCSHALVCSAGEVVPRTTDERPMNGEEFSRYSESTLLSAARAARRSWPCPDLGAHTGCPLLFSSNRFSPDDRFEKY